MFKIGDIVTPTYSHVDARTYTRFGVNCVCVVQGLRHDDASMKLVKVGITTESVTDTDSGWWLTSSWKHADLFKTMLRELDDAVC